MLKYFAGEFLVKFAREAAEGETLRVLARKGGEGMMKITKLVQAITDLIRAVTELIRLFRKS